MSKNQRITPPEPVSIRNLSELKSLINRLKPEDNAQSVNPIMIDTKKIGLSEGNVLIPSSSGQSVIRTTLLDGFQMVKNHMQYHAAASHEHLDIDDFGGFPPTNVPDPNDHVTWLDTFINRNMGGKREGLHIVWDLPEGKFRFDPWTCKLEKVDA